MSVDLIALERASARRWFVAALAASATAFLSVLLAMSAVRHWQTDARLTYVKLSPNGTWDVAQDLDASVVYFDSTLRTVLYDWIERRYSQRAATVQTDWGVAYASYSPDMQKWFTGEFGATAKAAKLAACATCAQTVVRVRSHQHIDPLPRNPGAAPTEPVRTLVYATESTYSGSDAVKPTAERRLIFRVTWLLQSKAQIQSRPELLRYNPIGLEILDVQETEDPQ
jgi:hypothetical protein